MNRYSSIAMLLTLTLANPTWAQDDAFEDLDIPAEESDGGDDFEEFEDSSPGEEGEDLTESELPPDEGLGETDAVDGGVAGGEALGDELDSDLDGLEEDLDSEFADEEAPADDGASDLAEEDIPEEGEGLGDTLGEAETQQGVVPGAPTATDDDGGLPDALLGSSEEVFDPNDPSYQLSRVPLLPPMSDENWRKWAGPALDKIHGIRKGDTLWGVSERLFGTPFLWPKVWQLNANLGNPHIIEPKLELQFKPGNPNSAPALALRMNEGQFIDIPMMVSTQKLGTIESIEALLDFLLRAPDPVFKKFLVQEAPEPIATMPKRPDSDKIFYAEGDRFEMADIEDGEYNIVRIARPEGRRANKTTYGASRLAWIGRLRVEAGKAYVTSSFEHIETGDAVVRETFEVPALAVQEIELGGNARTEFVPLDEGAYLGASQYRVFGLRLADEQVAPPGSLLSFEEKGFRVGTGLVVHRDGRFATVWVAESDKEIGSAQHIR